MVASTKQPAIDPAQKWTIRDVAKFLRCSADTAARWLARKDVPRYDIGRGRSNIRVLRVDVELAFSGCIVKASDPMTAGEHRAGYVPKYKPEDAVTPATLRKRSAQESREKQV